MDANKILAADLLDILFDNRNKDYGAYELRKTYNRRALTALIVTFTICLALFLIYILKHDDSKQTNPFEVTQVELTNLREKDVTPEPPPPPPAKRTAPQVEVAKYVTIQITKDNLVEPQDEVKMVEDLANTQIGIKDIDGVKTDGFTAPPVEGNSVGAVEPVRHEEVLEKRFIKVEKEASFPGGLEGWKRYLERSLNAQVAADEGAPFGSYRVKVKFMVDPEGNISNVEAIEVPKECPGCGPEAVRVIRRGPKWEPAIQNGQKVNYQAVQYITFQVSE